MQRTQSYSMAGLLAGAALLLLAAQPAAASMNDNGASWYFRIAGGGVLSEDIDTENLIDEDSDEELELNPNYAFVGAIGGNLYENMRIEFEAGLRKNSADVLTDPIELEGELPMDGEVLVYNMGVNLFYDFQTGWPIEPYVGLGVGAVHFEAEGIHREGEPTFNQWEGRDWGFYYQLILGLTFLRHEDFSLFGEYRFMGTDGIEAASEFGAFIPDINTEDVHNHAVLFGGRIRLEAL